MAIELDADGVAWRALPDERLLALLPLTYGRLRLTIGYGNMTYDDGW
jgi:hypothetical protein